VNLGFGLQVRHRAKEEIRSRVGAVAQQLGLGALLARRPKELSGGQLWRVVVPNLGPALAALGILLFVSAWNEYFWPLPVYRNPNSVIQLGIQGFLNSVAVNYGALMAASALATIPIFVIYALLQRRLVNAFVRSGLR
jgi:multiple sugar transport system permease protein